MDRAERSQKKTKSGRKNGLLITLSLVPLYMDMTVVIKLFTSFKAFTTLYILRCILFLHSQRKALKYCK